MAAGYRDAYQVFLMLSRGMTLRGQIFKMSVKDVALYALKKWYGEDGGIQYVARIKQVQIKKRNQIDDLPSSKTNDYVYFKLEPWEKLNHLIRPVGYGIQVYTMTTMSLLNEVQELP